MLDKSTSILISGDLVINQNYDKSNISTEIIDLFKKSDLNIVNLEAPITVSSTKGFKLGPYLKGNEQATENVLKNLNVHIATLANNHIMDYGEEGLRDTITFLNKNKIECIGAGSDIENASKTLFKEINGLKIAFINIAENEWSSAEENSGGAHPFDIINNVSKIYEARQLGYKVILIIHGGLEYYNYPIPFIKKSYRFFADQGADLIVSHHTHCIGGYEIYNNVPIYYSLGNFIFTKESSKNDWYVGQILDVVYEDGKFHSKLVGIKQSRGDFKLSLLKEEELQRYQNKVNEICKVIKNDKILNDNYYSFINSISKQYLNSYSLIPFFKRGILLKMLKKFNINFHTKYSVAFILNLVRCETHHAVSKSVFKNYLKK